MMPKKRILVVDDDEDIRKLLTKFLESEGYDVFTAIHGKDALEQLQSAEPPGLILLDLMMPVMDGWDFVLAMHLDSKLSDIPTILITATPEKAQGIKPDRVVSKPLQLDRLLDLISERCR